MKLLLIEASIIKAGKWPEKERSKMTKYPALALPLLAALTPPEFEIRIINDSFETIDFDEKADLVGISFYTAATPRAYEIADTFRSKGVKVVLGGVHVSALPEEASPHADAIVVGEGEALWPKVLEDFKNGSLQKVYKADGYIDMAIMPPARIDLLNKKHYMTKAVIQASRGCSLGCEFCSIEKLFGKKLRKRPVEKVVEEIKAMGKPKVILFSDDNLIMDPQYTKELFTAIKPLKIHWMGEASWTIGKRDDLLKLFHDSGCIGLLVGLESIRAQEHTKKVSKYEDMRTAYGEAIKNIHKHQMVVVGTFCMGFDNDDISSFDDTLNFCHEADIDFVEYNLIMPFPETPLFRRLSEEGRIVSTDWVRYNYELPGDVFKIKNMTLQDVNVNIRRILHDYYSFRHMIPRFIRQCLRYRNIVLMASLALVHLSYRKKLKFLRSCDY